MIGRTKPSRAPGYRHKHTLNKKDYRPPDTARSLLRRKTRHSLKQQRKQSGSTMLLTTTRKPLRLHSEYSSKTSSNAGSHLEASSQSPAQSESDRESLISTSDSSSGAPPLPPTGSLPSYSWADQSCWLDCSLEILFQCVMRDFTSFEQRFNSVPKNSTLYMLYNVMNQRRISHTESSVSNRPVFLSAHRDDLRQQLAKEVPSIISSTTSEENAFVSGYCQMHVPNRN